MRAAIVVACVLYASTASAQGWGREALEKMSGPKLTGDDYRANFLCQRSDGPEWPWKIRFGEEKLFCFDAAFAHFWDSDDVRPQLGGEVTANRYEASLIVDFNDYKKLGKWWHHALRPLQPSLALGAMNFRSEPRDTWRLVFSPRIIVRPAAWFSTSKWARVFQMRFRQMLISPDITDRALGITSVEAFNHGWLSGKVYYAFDLWEVFPSR